MQDLLKKLILDSQAERGIEEPELISKPRKLFKLFPTKADLFLAILTSKSKDHTPH